MLICLWKSVNMYRPIYTSAEPTSKYIALQQNQKHAVFLFPNIFLNDVSLRRRLLVCLCV